MKSSAKLKRGRSTSKKYVLRGGPYSGQEAYLPESTMVFKCQGYRGRYVCGRWEDV